MQLISLAGLHSTATISTELSRSFKDEGMLAYVRLIQSREKELGVDVLTHQKWSGAPYLDGIMASIQSGSSSSKSMGEGNTEKGKRLVDRYAEWDADYYLQGFRHDVQEQLTAFSKLMYIQYYKRDELLGYRCQIRSTLLL